MNEEPKVLCPRCRGDGVEPTCTSTAICEDCRICDGDGRIGLDAIPKLYKIAVDAQGNIDAVHRLLSAAGIPSAAGAVCADRGCKSHLMHRTHVLIAERDEALARLAQLQTILVDKALTENRA